MVIHRFGHYRHIGIRRGALLRVASRRCKTSSIIRKILKRIPVGISRGVVLKVAIEVILERVGRYGLSCALSCQLLHSAVVRHLLI